VIDLDNRDNLRLANAYKYYDMIDSRENIFSHGLFKALEDISHNLIQLHVGLKN
jgi:hypothetical protein